jgi:DNA-binding transcriptional ArsR family regulator
MPDRVTSETALNMSSNILMALTYLNIFDKIFSNPMEKEYITPEKLERAASMLKAIAHPIRISIIGILENGEKLTVTEIHNSLGIEQSTASHHLGILRDKGVLLSKREGKNTYYFLRHERLRDIIACLDSCGE